MNEPSTIAPHIFFISLFLTAMWGLYLVRTARDWRRKKGAVRFKRLMIAVCVWILPASFTFRTLLVLIGHSLDWYGIVSFFALVGVNVVGSIFAVTTRDVPD